MIQPAVRVGTVCIRDDLIKSWILILHYLKRDVDFKVANVHCNYGYCMSILEELILDASSRHEFQPVKSVLRLNTQVNFQQKQSHNVTLHGTLKIEPIKIFSVLPIVLPSASSRPP